MESIDERPAQPCHDLYSNMVTIIRVACKMSWGGNDICMQILVCYLRMCLVCVYTHLG